MREEGFVKSVSGELCEVVVSRKSACGENCASCSGNCKMQKQICIAENIKNANVGDRVIIEMDSFRILMSAFLVYIVPLLAFFAAFFALSGVKGEAFAGFFAVFAAILVFFALHLFDKRCKKDYISKVVEII